jgi:prepilin-type N-terminal cleavage/methylation domain-containing protein
MNAILRTVRHNIRNTRGVTLVELMIATAILSIGVLGMVGGFGAIQKVVQVSKTKTLASNLAQQQMQILSQLNYYQLLATPAPAYITNVTPNIPYDPTYFPPQTVLQGGITYTWYTYIQEAVEVNDAIVVQPPSTPDTGMKLVTLTVAWTQAGIPKQATVNSLMSNPNSVMTNAVFTGTFTNSLTGAVIAGATADIAENMGWRATTNASGVYTIGASPGNYNLVANAAGYFPQYATVSVAQNQTLNTPFLMVPIATSSVEGTAWLDSHLVISQVVATTTTCTGFPCTGNTNVEYVELFNPTTYQINIVTPPLATAPPWLAHNVTENVKINTIVGSPTPNSDIMNCAGNTCVYVSSYVLPGGYYLLASYAKFMVNGAVMTADAYFGNSTTDVIADSSYGGVQVQDNLGNLIDRVCWNGTSGPPPTSFCGNTYVPTDGTCGLNVGEPPLTCAGGAGPYEGNQLVRYPYPTLGDAVVSRGTDGSAYDTGYNDIDFSSPSALSGTLGLQYSPFTTASPALPVISGVPANKAIISVDDGLSTPIQATSASDVRGASSTFVLTDVATGTWSVFISSNGYLFEADSQLVTAAAPLVFPSATTLVTSTDTKGFVAGTVTDVLGNPISVPTAITVSGGGATNTASTVNGRYFLRTSTGSVDVVANPGSSNGDYVALSSNSVFVQLGEVSDGVNFMLSQGGQISGFVTRDGINALPGVAVSVIDANGFADDTEITNSLGQFTTIVVATGSYEVTPELDTIASASPTYYTTTVTSGLTVFSTTFTITNALGVVTGTATLSGQAISTGVLIIVTTSTLTGSAPPNVSVTAMTVSPNYAGSSLEDGTYSISVRQSTSPAYNIYAYYSTVSSTGGVILQTKNLTGVQVLAGQTVTGKSFAW